MDNINNYWNIFVSTGNIDDYMNYKKIEQINKTTSINKISKTEEITRNKNNLL